jgi:iron complex transport system substrate-binding protein
VSVPIYKPLRRALLIGAGALLICNMLVEAQTNSSAAVGSPATREVTDGYGRTVRVPLNPSRIISLAPSLTETVYALGVEDRLVGDTDYCDYPPDAQKKPKVGGVINPNLEQIAALHPDLVLVTKEGNLLETVRALDSLGIPTYATDIHSIEQIITSIQKLSDVLNVSEEGKLLAANLQLRLSTLQTKLNGVTPRRVLFVVWPDPLQSVGKNTFVADALRRAGAVSIVDSNQDWPQVSLEEVALLQPDDLIFAPSHSGGAGNDFDSVANRPGWEILNAVRNRRYAVVSEAIIRPAPRIVSVIEELARQLHPEVFVEKPGPEKVAPPENAGPPAPSAVQQKSISYPAVSVPVSMESPCAL